jgi:CMP-N-acetylneuraminic acid synthetase/spore coat polysaccharide biosynthesis predicted glycosyltransferase SpsG
VSSGGTTLPASDPAATSSPDRTLLAIVPARGGSKGVPFKNTRRLGDRPLVAYTVEAVAEAGVADRLVVSSDDDQVLRWAELHGYETHARPSDLAGDEATISAVAAHLVTELDWSGDVAVFQPTSPLRSAASIVRAVAAFRSADVDSLSSCVRERHLFWFDETGDLSQAQPLFAERVNRQYAHHGVLRETGSIQLVRAAALRSGGQMVTERHLLFETDPEESLDIDTTDDLVEARRRIEQGTVVFRVRATRRIGSGHVHHCLQLADELADQRLRFLLSDCDPFVADLLASHGFESRPETDLVADLEALAGPSGGRVVVNDILDTSEHDVLAQRAAGWRVVNIEDLGPGARLADWVVNALYPLNHGAGPHVVTGPRYATLRSEFRSLPPKTVRPSPERVLITFGGTDPGQLAPRCAHLLAGAVDVELRVIVGPGAPEMPFPPGVQVLSKVRSMAAEMLAADLVMTSAGRTVYEAAATGTPVAVLAQGARDATHSHLDFNSGVVFLGIGPLTDDRHIVETVRRLLGDHELRSELSERLRASIDGLGAVRIADRIRVMLRGLDA